MLTRRALLILLSSVAMLQTLPALASDDDSGGEGGNSGSGSSNSGSGSSNSGSGSSNSGSGSSNSGSGSSNSGSGSSNSGSGNDDSDDSGDDNSNDAGDDDSSEGDDDQEQAQQAVAKGEAVELRKVLATIRRRYPGRVVSVRLRGKGSTLQYRIGVIDKNNRLINLRINARTGQIISGSQ